MGIREEIRKKFVIHKTLKEGWTYISTSDGSVIGVKISITKVMRLYKPDGTSITDASGNPAYEFQSVNVARVLTPQEWEAVKKEGLEV